MLAFTTGERSNGEEGNHGQNPKGEQLCLLQDSLRQSARDVSINISNSLARSDLNRMAFLPLPQDIDLGGMAAPPRVISPNALASNQLLHLLLSYASGRMTTNTVYPYTPQIVL